jgi:hypothetical protein
MNVCVLADAISWLDADMLEQHLKKKGLWKIQSTKQKKTNVISWVAAVVASLLLVTSLGIGYQYIPTRYELDYSYTGNNGEEVGVLDENVWIYYVDGSGVKRKRVTLPCTAENVFITWKHLNGIGDDVKLICYEIVSNGTERPTQIAGEDVIGYTPGDRFTANITVSKTIENYGQGSGYNKLLETLKRSMTSYSNIDFDEVNIILK